jgi:tripartite-type tricarboxylate transporter receptor subunit TctC
MADGVPAERAQAVRSAMGQIFADPVFQTEAARSKLDLSPRSGEAQASLLDQLMRTPRSVVTRVADILGTQ